MMKMYSNCPRFQGGHKNTPDKQHLIGGFHMVFYTLEAHIMYHTVSSSFLISFIMGGSGPSRVIKFLNAPERPEQGD
jgi:hypothetical protein